MTIPRSAALLAFLLVLAACGSGGDETATPEADGTTTTVTTTDASATDATVVDDLDDLDTDLDEEVGGATMLPLQAILASVGLEATDELVSCLAERGVADQVDVSEGLGVTTGALMGCAPEQMGALLAAQIEVEGLDAEQSECVLVEVSRAAGALDAEAAQAAFESESTEIPTAIREAVLGTAPDACGLTAAEVEAVLDAP